MKQVKRMSEKPQAQSRTMTMSAPSAQRQRRVLLSALAGAAALPLLSACGSRPPMPRALDLGTAPAWSGAALPRRVEVQAVSAAEVLQGTGMVYRLDYADPYSRRVYRDSRWAAPVPSLVAARLRQQASRAALVSGADAAAPIVVTVELEDCVQRFSSATQSEVSLRLSVGIAGSATRKTFEGSASAGGDADGAVRATAQVLDRLGPELLLWAATAAPRG